MVRANILVYIRVGIISDLLMRITTSDRPAGQTVQYSTFVHIRGTQTVLDPTPFKEVFFFIDLYLIYIRL